MAVVAALGIIVVAALESMQVLDIISKFGSSPTEPEPEPPIVLTAEIRNNNRETFTTLRKDLLSVTLGSDNTSLAINIAQQETMDGLFTQVETALTQLWNNPDQWTNDQSEPLFDWVQALQRNSGREVTGYLTPDDPLYRVLKRRASRDIALTANPLPTPWTFSLPTGYQNFTEGENDPGIAIVQEYLKALDMYGDGVTPSPGVFDNYTTAAVKKFQPGGDGTVGQETWDEMREASLKQTVEGIRALLKHVATSCSGQIQNSDVKSETLDQVVLKYVKDEIYPPSPENQTDTRDSKQGQLIQWNAISGATIDLNQQSVKDFETALVRYKYPLVDIPVKKTNTESSLDPIPTLIPGYDNEALYDLELGVRQQLQCWDGLENSPYKP